MKMKRLTRWAAALGMAALLLCGSAFAAGENTIAVQLNGEDLTFTDAVPQVRDQRTFLPFRAVFEAMGAQVGNNGNVITATRGDKTLTMTIGETTATVTEKGISRPITMDVAPYVDNATWRTYVPVRFAAQAFDCSVGWDQGAYTAIIVDTEKLVEETLAGKQFTYLEKLSQYSEKYNEGIWDMKAGMAMDASLLTAPLMSMEGAINGTVQNGEKMSMDMNLKMDLSGLLAAYTPAPLDTEEAALQQALLDALATSGIDTAMKMDMTTGRTYMNLNDKGTGILDGLEGDTWYQMDMAKIMEQAGISWADVLAMSKDTDLLGALTPLLGTMLPAPNSAATSYAEIKAGFEALCAAFSDEGFRRDEKGMYTATYSLQTEEMMADVYVSLDMNKNAVQGYEMGVSCVPGLSGVSVVMGMDAEDKMNAEVKAVVSGGMLVMNMTMEGGYTQGKTAPVTEPPAGATVVDYMEMLGGDLGVIGGADGPTAIIGQ